MDLPLLWYLKEGLSPHALWLLDEHIVHAKSPLHGTNAISKIQMEWKTSSILDSFLDNETLLKPIMFFLGGRDFTHLITISSLSN